MRGGGKGALISNERSLTLAAAGNDQAVFTGNNALNFEMWTGECVAHSPCLQHLRAGDTLTYKDAATFWNGNQYAESLTCTSDRQLMPDKARLQCVVETPIVLNDQGGSVMQVQNGGNGTGAQEELAYTQNASGVMGVANSATVRRLLPIECERLMGFPDNWTRISWKGKPAEECPDSPRYKAAGNSMCVNVMRWIGMRIELVERRLGR